MDEKETQRLRLFHHRMNHTTTSPHYATTRIRLLQCHIHNVSIAGSHCHPLSYYQSSLISRHRCWQQNVGPGKLFDALNHQHQPRRHNCLLLSIRLSSAWLEFPRTLTSLNRPRARAKVAFICCCRRRQQQAAALFGGVLESFKRVFIDDILLQHRCCCCCCWREAAHCCCITGIHSRVVGCSGSGSSSGDERQRSMFRWSDLKASCIVSLKKSTVSLTESSRSIHCYVISS